MRMYPLVHPHPIFFGLFNPGFQASRSGVTSASAASVQGNMKACGESCREFLGKRKGKGGGKQDICIYHFYLFVVDVYVFYCIGFLPSFVFEGCFDEVVHDIVGFVAFRRGRLHVTLTVGAWDAPCHQNGDRRSFGSSAESEFCWYLDIYRIYIYIHNIYWYILYIDTFILYIEINWYELAFNKESATMLPTTVPLRGPICTTTKSGS